MAMAHRYSAKAGLCPPDLPARIETHLAEVGLPTRLGQVDGPWTPDSLLTMMAQDKKVVDGRLRFILARGIGAAFVADDVPLDAVRGVLTDALAAR
jgi:3-dehydroquinate synthase